MILQGFPGFLFFTGYKLATSGHFFVAIIVCGYGMMAKEIRPGQLMSGGHMAVHVTRRKLMEPVPVYDMTVPKYFNFILDNGLVVHNSGKSFSAKREITNAFLVTKDDIIICDPEGEYENSKGFFCNKEGCRFALWKNSRFFSAKKKQLTTAIARELLVSGRVFLKGCYSPKSGITYDATAVLEDDGKKTELRLVFENK